MNIALILAGGSGTRMSSKTPKQLLSLNGKPVITYSLEAFQKNKDIDAIYVVCSKNIIDSLNIFFDKSFGFTKLQPLVLGGETRKDSSFNGLKQISANHSPNDIILIHDAARPLVSQEIIDANIQCAKDSNACATVIPATDTVLVSTDGKNIVDVADRSTMYLAQTPQTFKLSVVLSAFENSTVTATDDTSIVLNDDVPVKLILGNKRNIKLTTHDDFIIVKAYIAEYKY